MIISYLRINGKTTDIELARREDKNYAQLERDTYAPFVNRMDAIPTGYCKMDNFEQCQALWSDGTYYDTDVVTVANQKYEPQNKYDKENTKVITIKLNKKTDADILEKLESVDAMQTYIKEAIRKDLK